MTGWWLCCYSEGHQWVRELRKQEYGLNSTAWDTKPHFWGGVGQWNSVCWGPPFGRQLCRKRKRQRSLWTTCWTQASSVPLWSTDTLGWFRKSNDNGLRKLILSLLNPVLMRPHLECYVCFWAPQYKTDVDVLRRMQHKVHKDDLGFRASAGEAERAGFVYLGEGLEMSLINVCKHTNGIKEPAASWWYPAERKEAVDTNFNTRNSI